MSEHVVDDSAPISDLYVSFIATVIKRNLETLALSRTGYLSTLFGLTP